MAIKDIQQQLIKSEGQSGEFLFKQLEVDLNTVYNRGYGDEKTPLLDSYWEQARKEFSDEGKNAVRKGKSAAAAEVLKDLEVFQKSLEATAEVSSGIKVGTLAMLLAVKPHIEKRITTLKKNEGIFKSMRKKAVASAAGAVEGFASGLLAPLPFGAGQAIIEKTKGFLGAGKGDKAERQAEQAVSFAGRIERDGGTGGPGSNGPGGGGGGGGGAGDGSGDVVQALGRIEDLLVAGLFGSPPLLLTMSEKIEDLTEVSKPDKETIREERRKSDRQHKQTMDAMKKAGGIGAAGAAGAGAGGEGGLDVIDLMLFDEGKKGLGKLKNWFKGTKFTKFLLPAMATFLSPKNLVRPILHLMKNPMIAVGVATAAAAGYTLFTGKLPSFVPTPEEQWEKHNEFWGNLTKEEKKAKKREMLEQHKAGLPMGGERKQSFMMEMMVDTIKSLHSVAKWFGLGGEEHEKGIWEIGKTGPGMVSKGDTILDNTASKDFKEGMGTFKGLMGHQEGIGTVKSDYLAKLHKGETQIKGGMGSVMEQVMGMLTEKFGLNAIFGPSEGRTPSQLKRTGWSASRKAMQMKEYMWNQQKDVSELAQMLLSGDSMENDWTYMGDAMIDMAPRKGMLFKDVMSNVGGKTLQTVKEITQKAKQAREIDYHGHQRWATHDFDEALGRGEMRDRPFTYGEESRIVKKMADTSISELLSPLKQSFMSGQMDLEDIQGKIKFSEKFAGMSPEGLAGMKGKVEKGRLEYRGMRELREMQLAKQNRILEEKSRKSIAEVAERERLKKRKGGVTGQQKFVFKGGKMVVADQTPKEPSWMSGKHGLNLGNYDPDEKIPTLLHGKEEVIEGPQIARIEQALAGNQLNNAAYNRVGLGGPAGQGSGATVINAPTTVSNNNTISPPRMPSPHARDAFGERKDFVSKIA